MLQNGQNVAYGQYVAIVQHVAIVQRVNNDNTLQLMNMLQMVNMLQTFKLLLISNIIPFFVEVNAKRFFFAKKIKLPPPHSTPSD